MIPLPERARRAAGLANEATAALLLLELAEAAEERDRLRRSWDEFVAWMRGRAGEAGAMRGQASKEAHRDDP